MKATVTSINYRFETALEYEQRMAEIKANYDKLLTGEIRLKDTFGVKNGVIYIMDGLDEKNAAFERIMKSWFPEVATKID